MCFALKDNKHGLFEELLLQKFHFCFVMSGEKQ